MAAHGIWDAGEQFESDISDFAGIVQLVERLPCKQYVQGSSPCLSSMAP